jgi:hypothetical protein|tara:strand:- start:127 stop:381 length:255 start_codon:yes stop_codon:yes gene_type:complete
LQPRYLTKLFFKNVTCEKCEINLNEQKPRVAYSISKKKNSGFLCVHCSLEKHFITDQEIINFLKCKIIEKRVSVAVQNSRRARY